MVYNTQNHWVSELCLSFSSYLEFRAMVKAHKPGDSEYISFNYLLARISHPGPPLWSSGQSSWLLTQRSWVRFPALPIVCVAVVLERGPLSPCESK
jgi:hypothetical protein